MLIDDEALLRRAIRVLLKSEQSFDIVGEATDGVSGVRMADDLRPDVVVIDVRMPGEINGVEATRKIMENAAESGPLPAIIGLSGSSESAPAVMEAGAQAFLEKQRVLTLITLIKQIRLDHNR